MGNHKFEQLNSFYGKQFRVLLSVFIYMITPIRKLILVSENSVTYKHRSLAYHHIKLKLEGKWWCKVIWHSAKAFI